jgi:integrase
MRTSDRKTTGRRSRVERGIYRQPNGKYAVCFMLDGKLTFRTVGYELDAARRERCAFVEAARWGVVASAPRLRFGQVAGWWVERFARRVAADERCERTLEFRRYHLEHHLLPAFGDRLLREITVRDVADLLDSLREHGRAENTIAGALSTLQCVLRFAVRNGWIPDSPVDKLEADERPHPNRLAHRVLGRDEIRRLLDACLPAYRPLIATALYTGMRQSELLGLTWDDVEIPGGRVHVRAQLSRARSGAPCCRVRLKTRSARRQIPLSPQLAALLRGHREASKFNAASDWVFATRNGTPFHQRNVQRSALSRAAHSAGLDGDGARLRFHDLRHTFASHLIVDLALDVVQVSRILGHASPATTLDIYAHLFDDARHAADIRARMSRSEFASILTPDTDKNVIRLPAAARAARAPLSARERAALRWAT